jgi:DNA-binding protein H-NS
MTKKMNLDSMSVDEMWQLHEEISRLLSVRLTSEKRELEKRLEQLRRDKRVPAKHSNGIVKELARAPRRKYPRVSPKYQNPQVPSETWSGRGKTPRWLVAALKTGQKLEDFAISAPTGIPVRKQKNNAHNAR